MAHYSFIRQNSLFFSSSEGVFPFSLLFYCSHACHKKVTFRNVIHGPWENMTNFIISDCNFQQKKNLPLSRSLFLFFSSAVKPIRMPNYEVIKTNTIYLLNVDLFLAVIFSSILNNRKNNIRMGSKYIRIIAFDSDNDSRKM